MRKINKAVIILLTIAIISVSMVGCSSKGKTFMTLGDEEMSVNMFQLFLSRQKATLCSSYGYGSQANLDSFWDTVMNVSGTTYNDYYTEYVLENAKTYLAALALFEEKGLKLPDSYIDEIEAELDEIMEQDADGSKAAFNSILSEYGVNYNILKEARIMEAKISYLQDELFGADGSKISPALMEEYFSDTYVRFKQIFFYTYAIVYETDENGDSIYYNEDKTVAYDTSKTPKRNEKGDFVKDAQGNTVYVNDDGSIAYDKKNGSRKAVTDSSGNAVTEDFSAQKINQIKQDALTIMGEAVEGDFVNFDALVEEYSQDLSLDDYKNGYYITANAKYDNTQLKDIVDALFEMEVGDVRLVQSAGGFHVIMKYDLGERPYEDEDNEKSFVNQKTGEYVFMEDLKNRLFADYLEKYKADVVVERELIEGINIKSVSPNFYY